MNRQLRTIGSSHGVKSSLLYGLMVAGTVVLFLIIAESGKRLCEAPSSALTVSQPSELRATGTLYHVLLALAAVIISGRLLGALLAYLHQPPVIGEVIAGILIGPSLLGRWAPAVSAHVLPPSAAPFLEVIAQIGVILYMFLVGLELDPALLRKRGYSTIAISHGSIIIPFLFGAALALGIYPTLSARGVPFSVFALFLGVSMSVTAFPVLARILSDLNMTKTRLGVIAITCAAADDVTAWCLLALVVSVVQAKIGGALITMALAVGYIAFMFFAARPFVARLVKNTDEATLTSPWLTAIVLAAMLASALVTELIGIHAIFGAFLLGAIVPHDSPLARSLIDRLQNVVLVLFLPAFFAFTGMRTQIGLVSGVHHWLICGAIIAVATLGKFGGSFVVARLTGLGSRDAASLGILMNTRGLMELVVLNVGLDLGIISPTLFAMLVLMAIVTTMATTPVLNLLQTRRHALEPELATCRVA